MICITLVGRDPTEIIEIVRELRQQGMVQGKDFDFAYYQSKWDDMLGEIPRNVEFKFYVEKYATLFSLKYGS
jgi:hypothetical protein